MRWPAILLAFGLLGAAHGGSAPTLIDQTGHRFALSDLRGSVAVVTFVAASCTDACPLVNAQFADAARRLVREAPKVRLITITLDPAHDTPAVMRALAHRFQADPRVWLVASGAPSDVREVMQRFGVVTQRGPHGDADAHTTFVYVLDQTGAIHAQILASTGLTDDIVAAVHDASRVASR